jgi:hypothetical protein
MERRLPIKVIKRSPVCSHRSAPAGRLDAWRAALFRTSTGTFAKKSIDSLKFADRSRKSNLTLSVFSCLFPAAPVSLLSAAASPPRLPLRLLSVPAAAPDGAGGGIPPRRRARWGWWRHLSPQPRPRRPAAVRLVVARVDAGHHGRRGLQPRTRGRRRSARRPRYGRPAPAALLCLRALLCLLQWVTA